MTKPLVANQKGKWRYHVGDYRIMTLIEDNEILRNEPHMAEEQEIVTV